MAGAPARLTLLVQFVRRALLSYNLFRACSQRDYGRSLIGGSVGFAMLALGAVFDRARPFYCCVPRAADNGDLL